MIIIDKKSLFRRREHRPAETGLKMRFSSCGGPAIEAAMKICIKNVASARDFVCLYDSYHGTTLGTMGASWISTRAGGKYIGGSRFLPLTRAVLRK